MKIFNKEDGQYVVYVQLKDITALQRFKEEIPKSILNKVYKDDLVIDSTNRMSFIRFDESYEVMYFYRFEWIVNYKVATNLGNKNLKEYASKLYDELNKLQKFLRNLDDESEIYEYIYIKSKELSYEINTLADILQIKNYNDNYNYELPDVADSLTLNYDCNNYTVKKSINPFKLLIFSNNGKYDDIYDFMDSYEFSTILMEHPLYGSEDYEIIGYEDKENHNYIVEFTKRKLDLESNNEAKKLRMSLK